MKNFHVYNTLFKYIINTYIIVQLMETNSHKNINKFKT